MNVKKIIGGAILLTPVVAMAEFSGFVRTIVVVPDWPDPLREGREVYAANDHEYDWDGVSGRITWPFVADLTNSGIPGVDYEKDSSVEITLTQCPGQYSFSMYGVIQGRLYGSWLDYAGPFYHSTSFTCSSA